MNRSDSIVAGIVEAAADSRERAVDHPRPVPELSASTHPLGSMLFSEAARSWLLTRRDHIAPRTYLDYGRYIEILSRRFRSVVLNDITGDMLRDYQRRRRQTAGPGMIKRNAESSA